MGQEEPSAPGQQRLGESGGKKRSGLEAEAKEEKQWIHVQMQLKGLRHGDAVIQ